MLRSIICALSIRLALTCAILGLAGCGSTTAPYPQQARAVKAANNLCLLYKDDVSRELGILPTADGEPIVKRVRELRDDLSTSLRALLTSSAQMPGYAAWLADRGAAIGDGTFSSKGRVIREGEAAPLPLEGYERKVAKMNAAGTAIGLTKCDGRALVIR
jgi:hypothetical protein